jgi:hypothetical protein
MASRSRLAARQEPRRCRPRHDVGARDAHLGFRVQQISENQSSANRHRANRNANPRMLDLSYLARATTKIFCICCWLVVSLSSVQAAEPKPTDAKAEETKTTDKSPPAGKSSDGLAQQQRQVADQFKHLEDVLLRMAELTATSDPRQAALLKKAVAQSKEQLLDTQFDRLVELLEKDQLSRAIEGQATVGQDLHALLELLLSENRAKQLEAQKKRIQEYLKRVGEIIKEQKRIQGRTAGGETPQPLSGEQQKLSEKTGGLAQQIKINEEGKTKSEEKERSAGAKEAKGGENEKPANEKETPANDKNQPAGQKGQPSEPKGQADEPKKDRQQPGGRQGEGQPKSEGEGQPKSEEKQAQSDQPEGQESEQEPGQDAAPARQRLEAARDRMKQAEDKLRQAERKGAVEKQEEALRELEQAKAALEEILRQLRQEEIQRMLAGLEVRFRKMLDMQRDVYEGTVRLDKVPAAQRTQSHEIEASQLSSKEGQIIAEADKALLLLREDGTAVVFAEAVEQMCDDMQQVVVRLSQAKVEQITQGIEQDIITALEEMLDALKKAQKDQEQKKPQRSAQGQPTEPPLVDGLAELKMIRALQMRVNTRTQRYSQLIDGEQAEKAELVEALQRLSERETRIHRVTRDLEMGRNQ